jgi:hypothetical protein
LKQKGHLGGVFWMAAAIKLPVQPGSDPVIPAVPGALSF